MNRTVNKLTIQPILCPCRSFNVIVQGAIFPFQQRIIHVAFGSSNDQFELLISAVVEVLEGIVIVKVVVDVLSEPKSSTATDLLPWVTL